MSQKPLYDRVRTRLLSRISAGEWAPGELIPTELELAAHYKVSQGTARKAVEELAGIGVLTRRQGKGTFVAAHGAGNGTSRFAWVRGSDGAPLALTNRVDACKRAPASPQERASLALKQRATVYRVVRTGLQNGTPMLLEQIVLPTACFDSVAPGELTDALYDYYQRKHGIHVVRVSDRLSAMAADRKQASALGLKPGSPILRIERVAYALNEQKVEWRICHCRPDRLQFVTPAT